MDELTNIITQTRHVSILLQRLKIKSTIENLANLITGLQILEEIESELVALSSKKDAEGGDDLG